MISNRKRVWQDIFEREFWAGYELVGLELSGLARRAIEATGFFFFLQM